MSVSAIFGRRGKGKSTLAYHHAKRLNRGVLIYDCNAQFTIGRVVDDLSDLHEAFERDESPIVFRPDNVERDFGPFAQIVWGCHDVSLIVDEASLLQSPQGIHLWLDKLIRLGRDREITVITTQHRPQDSHGIVMSLAMDMFFFRTTHPKDLSRIEDHTTEEVRQKVEKLEGFQYLHWSVEEETFYVNDDPASWRIQIRKPKLVLQEEVA